MGRGGDTIQQQNVNAYMRGCYNSLFNKTRKVITGVRDRNLVCSLPVTCEVLTAYQMLVPHNLIIEEWGYDYYGGVGTLAHSILQKWLGRVGMLFGVWKCPEKDCKYEKLTYKPYKYSCPKHKRPLVYKEFYVEDKSTGLRGKCDGLIVMPNPKKVIVTDFKFVDGEIVKQIQREDLDVTGSLYYEQVNTYASLLKEHEKTMGVTLWGTSLWFIDRGNIRNMTTVSWKGIDNKPLETIRRNVKKVRKILKKCERDGLQRADFSKLKRRCKSIEDAGFCNVKDLCFMGGGNVRSDLLNIMLDHKRRIERSSNAKKKGRHNTKKVHPK